MRIWLLALYDAIFALPWRTPHPGEAVRQREPLRIPPPRHAGVTLRYRPPKAPEREYRRGIH